MPTLPYADDGVNAIYDLLFADNVDFYKNSPTPPIGYPWDTLLTDDPEPGALQRIIDDERMEARVKLLAYQLLRATGLPVESRQLFGVVVEVGLPDGLDVVAAYADGTARYINYTGKAVFWDGNDATAHALVREMLQASLPIIEKIGPWNGPRRSHPDTGQLRLSFLVSDGLYFGEGPAQALFQDAMAGPVLRAALGLVRFLAEKV